ncbi:unnamed protein product [Scytosiphon promiscuus]
MNLAPTACAVMLFTFHLEPSQAFVGPSCCPDVRNMDIARASQLRTPTSTRSTCRRQRCRRTIAVAASVEEPTTPAGERNWEGSLIELDVVEYRKGPAGDDNSSIELASYVGDGKLQPLLTRKETGPRLFFHDEDAQPISMTGESCSIVRVVDEIYFSQRIVEDRVKNPHGEEAEDCFLLEGTLDPRTVIRVEHGQD